MAEVGQLAPGHWPGPRLGYEYCTSYVVLVAVGPRGRPPHSRIYCWRENRFTLSGSAGVSLYSYEYGSDYTYPIIGLSSDYRTT
eukprot:scaffold151714_cov31-Prasinocladus_malaysianus.AAC.1